MPDTNLRPTTRTTGTARTPVRGTVVPAGEVPRLGAPATRFATSTRGGAPFPVSMPAGNRFMTGGSTAAPAAASAPPVPLGSGVQVRDDVGTSRPSGAPFWFDLALFLQLPFKPAYRKVLRAQAAFETGNFTSRRYNEDNNAFGMRCARVRPQARRGCTVDGFAVYASVWQAVKDRIALDRYNGVAPPDSRRKGPDLLNSPWDNRVAEYMDDVLAAGYVPANERATYRQRWAGVYQQVNTPPNAENKLITSWWEWLIVFAFLVAAFIAWRKGLFRKLGI